MMIVPKTPQEVAMSAKKAEEVQEAIGRGNQLYRRNRGLIEKDMETLHDDLMRYLRENKFVMHGISTKGIDHINKNELSAAFKECVERPNI